MVKKGVEFLRWSTRSIQNTVNDPDPLFEKGLRTPQKYLSWELVKHATAKLPRFVGETLHYLLLPPYKPESIRWAPGINRVPRHTSYFDSK
jgi:hypothetical protein